MVKPWLFEFFRAPSDAGVLIPKARTGVAPSEVSEHFDVYWRNWTKAEDYGFEGIFFSEHHFGPGYAPSPHLLVAALARATKTMRLGVMGVVLPYYQPWRVIEEVGMLDHLTGGRLEVGTASGIPPEMALVGLGVAEANERNLEAQDILDWALAHPGEPITHHGKHWNFDNLTLVPRPAQSTPPRWTTIVSEGSARRAARRGTKICTGFASVETVTKLFDGYRAEADDAGLAVNPDWLGLRRNVTVCADASEARDISTRLSDQVRSMFLKHDDKVNHGPVPDAPQKAHGGQELADEEYIAGNPAQVAEQIIEQCRKTGAGHFLSLMDGHGTPQDNARAFDLFGKEVIPLLRKAGANTASAKAAAPAEA